MLIKKYTTHVPLYSLNHAINQDMEATSISNRE